jgi:hypothetical protein
MRCHFMRGGHVVAVDLLMRGNSDGEVIKASTDLLRRRIAEKQVLDRFELWHRSYFIFRFPAA